MQLHTRTSGLVLVVVAQLAWSGCQSNLDYPDKTDESAAADDEPAGTDGPRVQIDSGLSTDASASGPIPSATGVAPKPPLQDAGGEPVDPGTGGPVASGDAAPPETDATTPAPDAPDADVGPVPSGIPTNVPDAASPEPDSSSPPAPVAPLRLAAISPGPNAPGVSTGTDFVLTFDHPISLGEGTFSIVDAQTEAVFESVAAGDARLSVDGMRLTVDLDGVLGGSTSYAVIVDATIVVGEGGQLFAGIDLGDWTFSTAASPLPLPVDDLLLWVDANFVEAIKGPSGKVAFLPDRSRKNHFAQPTAGAQPALVAAQLGGKSVIRFDGTDDVLLGPDLNDPSEYDVFVVWRSPVTTSSTFSTIFSNGVLEGVHVQFSHGHSLADFRASVVSEFGAENYQGISFDVPVANQAYVWNATFSAGSLSAYTNGALNGTLTGITEALVATSEFVAIGGADSGEHNFQGDVAEVLFFERPLSGTERDQIEAYLGTKWGITVAP